MRTEKTNESEPLMKGRNVLERCQNRVEVVVPGEVQEARVFYLDGVRLEGGVSSVPAVMRNVGTSTTDAKGEAQARRTCESDSTDAASRGGATRSSREARESEWSEGVALSGRVLGSTSNGRSP